MWCLYSCCDQLCCLVSDGCHASMLSIALCASAAQCSDDGLVELVMRSLERSRSGGSGWLLHVREEEELVEVSIVGLVVVVILSVVL